MTHEKRSEIIRARVTPSLRADIEQAIQEEGPLVTMSDWLFEAAAERVALRSIRISKQAIKKRAGKH